MAAIQQDVGLTEADKFFAGSFREFTIQVLDEDNNPVDLTDFHLTWTLSVSPVDPVLVSKSGPPDLIILSQAPTSPSTKGQFTLTLHPADTDSLDGNYYHEVRAVDGAGNPDWVLYGTFAITPTAQ